MGWLQNYLPVLGVSLAISIFGLIQALIAERKKKQGKQEEEKDHNEEKLR